MHSRTGTCCSVVRNLFVWPRRAMAFVVDNYIYVYKLPLERCFDGARDATGQCWRSVVIAVGPERV